MKEITGPRLSGALALCKMFSLLIWGGIKLSLPCSLNWRSESERMEEMGEYSFSYTLLLCPLPFSNQNVGGGRAEKMSGQIDANNLSFAS